MQGANHPRDFASAGPFGRGGGDTAAGAFQGRWFKVIQTAVSFVNSTTAFGACNEKTRGPPVISVSPLPFINDVPFSSIPPALNDGGEGRSLGQEVNPGFLPGQLVRRALQMRSEACSRFASANGANHVVNDCAVALNHTELSGDAGDMELKA